MFGYERLGIKALFFKETKVFNFKNRSANSPLFGGFQTALVPLLVDLYCCKGSVRMLLEVGHDSLLPQTK